MELHGVARRVAAETDDVLVTLPLVAGNPALTDRLFAQLVDLLLEGILVRLRSDVVDGVLTADDYRAELAALAAECRQVGLLRRS